MKRIASLLLIMLTVSILTSCTNKNTLLFLNWGEYIDESLIESFEEKYNCTVVMDLADSNELFYSKVSSGTTVYDVVCPSDYMVGKMYENDMLAKIDFSKVPSYDKNNLLPYQESIADEMEERHEGISDYYVPYLGGTWGIMYSTKVEGLEESIYSNENEWACLFDRSTLPAGTRVAMYDSHQHAYYVACKYLGLDHTSASSSNLDKVYNLIDKVSFNAWGTDNIKKDIVNENIELGFMWTGDFLYYYCEEISYIVMEAYNNNDVSIDQIDEMIYALTGENKEYISEDGSRYDVGFDIFIPKDTIAFSDNLIITKDAAHKDLAHKFIDFMTSEEVSLNEENIINPAFANTYYVCYNTPFNTIYDQMVDLSLYEYSNIDEETHNVELNDGVDEFDSTLFYLIYDSATGIAFNKYYPKDEVKGNILAEFSRKDINRINTTFNNARA